MATVDGTLVKQTHSLSSTPWTSCPAIRPMALTSCLFGRIAVDDFMVLVNWCGDDWDVDVYGDGSSELRLTTGKYYRIKQSGILWGRNACSFLGTHQSFTRSI